MYTTDTSLIDDSRVTISDTEVSFVVETKETTEVYSMPTSDYANNYESQATIEITQAKH